MSDSERTEKALVHFRFVENNYDADTPAKGRDLHRLVAIGRLLYGEMQAKERERDALAARLATLTAAGITTGEDGAARWHGLTGAEIERLQSVEGVAWDMCGLQSAISHYLRGCHEQGLARRLEVFCDDLRALAAAAGRGADGEETDA